MPFDLQQSIQALLIGDQGAELLCGLQILHGLYSVDQHRQGLGSEPVLLKKGVNKLFL